MADPIAARFGRRIAAERKRRRLSTESLAASAGVGRNVIRNLEQGLLGSRLDSAVKLAGALDISLDGLSGPCERCGDHPAAWTTCNACGASGEESRP